MNWNPEVIHSKYDSAILQACFGFSFVLLFVLALVMGTSAPKYFLEERYANTLLKLRLEKSRQEWHKECTSLPEDVKP